MIMQKSIKLIDHTKQSQTRVPHNIQITIKSINLKFFRLSKKNVSPNRIHKKNIHTHKTASFREK